MMVFWVFFFLAATVPATVKQETTGAPSSLKTRVGGGGRQLASCRIIQPLRRPGSLRLGTKMAACAEEENMATVGGPPLPPPSAPTMHATSLFPRVNNL